MLLDSLMSESGATWIEHRVLNGRGVPTMWCVR